MQYTITRFFLQRRGNTPLHNFAAGLIIYYKCYYKEGCATAQTKPQKQVLGILGGLGPAASCYPYQMLIDHTPASCDQDHIDIVISSRASTPDRTAFIMGKSKDDPFAVMEQDGFSLVHYGATVLAIPCNTAHYFYDRLAEALPVPVLNMPRLTVADAKAAGRNAEPIASGIHYVYESRREYPNAQVGGQVVGACSIGVDSDTNREYYYGICGLEAQYNDVLSGTPGYMEQEYGQTGQIIPSGTHEKVDAIDGQDIVVSIDIELQRQVEESLTSGCKGLNATGGSAVLMDGSTGEIYAAASLPLFNPADRSEVKEGAMQLKCVTDLFEPGSIFKSVSAMAILETGTLTPDSELFCPASITADGYTISDAHERGDATFTLRQILDQSSNVGISLATEKMGFEELYNHIVRYNLHSDTGVDYPGEGEEGTDALGMLAPYDQWSAVQAYNVSFGQGVSVTPLQMTRFYGAIVNNGVECVPHFLIGMPQSGTTPAYGTTQVIENTDALGDMQSMLKTVVTDGTGAKAAIDGFNVAGKTSTAEIYDEENGGYRKNVCRRHRRHGSGRFRHAQGHGRGVGALLRRSVARAFAGGRHGHERQNHYHLPGGAYRPRGGQANGRHRHRGHRHWRCA